MSAHKIPLLSIVIPVYNEEPSIVRCYTEVTKVMTTLTDTCDYEIFFTNNCSTDKTWNMIKEIGEKDKRVKGISYSKNFGYQRSIYQGYLECSGDMAIQLDCDLQDDPSLIPSFINKWQEGNKIVYGVRRTRQESKALEFIRKFYYRLVDFISEEPLPFDVGEFRLIDRTIIEELRKLDDHNPYLRGLVATLGFKQAKIYYDRNKRIEGETKFHAKQLFQVAFDGILNHSILPLRLATYFGLAVSLVSIILIVGYIFARLFFGSSWPAGFTTLTVLILLGMGLNAFFLGILGEYIGRIYRQIKKRPIAIIEEKINVK